MDYWRDEPDFGSMVDYECTDGSDQIHAPIMREGKYVGDMSHEDDLRHYLRVVQANAHKWAEEGSNALQWLEAIEELEQAIECSLYPF